MSATAITVHEESIDTFRYPYPKVVSKLNEQSRNQGRIEYPKVKYHAQHGSVVVEDIEEEEMLNADEWKDTPGELGIVTLPSQADARRQMLGFDFEEVKKKKRAERERRRLDAIKAAENETEEDEEEETTKRSSRRKK